MERSQSAFFLLFLYSAATGGVLGVVYDAIRILRALILPNAPSGKINYADIELPLIRKKVYKPPKKKLSRAAIGALVAIGDFVFMIICAVALILVAYTENMGKMRWLIPFGAAVGFAAYGFTVGRLIVKISGAVVFLIRAVLVYVYTLAEIPVRFIVGKIKNRKRKPKKEKIKKRRKRWHIRKRTDAVLTTESSK